MPPTSKMSNNSDSEMKHMPLKEASFFLKDYFIWIVFALGFPGNLISLVIIIRMARKRLRTSLFFVGLLAVVDNLSIIMKIVASQHLRNKFYITAIGCQFMIFLRLTFTVYGNWILVVISIERFTAVMFSLKINAIWSLTKAMFVVSVLFLVLVLVHIHLFFTITTYGNIYCVPTQLFYEYYRELAVLISTVYSIAPSLLMIVFNSLTIWKLWKSTRERKSLSESSNIPSANSKNQEKQVTVMLVTLSIVFVLLTIPTIVYFLTYSYFQMSSMNFFLGNLANAMSDLNHAVNFYLYICLVKTFRKQCYMLLPC